MDRDFLSAVTPGIPVPDLIHGRPEACPRCGTALKLDGRASEYIVCQDDACGVSVPAATWLFVRSGRNPQGPDLSNHASHNVSESFTTAFFVLFLLSRCDPALKKLPIREVTGRDRRGWRCELVASELDLSRLDYSNITSVEKGGSRAVDVNFDCGGKAIVIENKPWARESGPSTADATAKVLSQFERYETIGELYVLISVGNPQGALWETLATDRFPKPKFRIILWEEVLARMDRAGFGHDLLPSGLESLRPYYGVFLGLQA